MWNVVKVGDFEFLPVTEEKGEKVNLERCVGWVPVECEIKFQIIRYTPKKLERKSH
jgi:hypothetical protein